MWDEYFSSSSSTGAVAESEALSPRLPRRALHPNSSSNSSLMAPELLGRAAEAVVQMYFRIICGLSQ